MNDVAYLYDGTFDGFLSAVFESYVRKEEPAVIAARQEVQLAFGRRTVTIATSEEKARRVERGFVRRTGQIGWKKLWTVFLCGEPEKELCLYRYMRGIFSQGEQFAFHLTHEDVHPIERMYRSVANETHCLTGFTRFSEMEGGIFFAKITPKHNVVPLLMPHFADRFCNQPFLLYDRIHTVCGVYDGNRWYLVETEFVDLPNPSEQEDDYRRLWKRFYDSVAVPGRENPTCRRTHMPKRFWPNMTEFQYVKESKPQSDCNSMVPKV